MRGCAGCSGGAAAAAARNVTPSGPPKALGLEKGLPGQPEPYLKSNDDLNSAGPPKLLLTLAAWLRVRVGDADNSEEAVVASATQRVPPYSLRFQKGFPGLPVPNLKLSRSALITTPKIKAAALLRCVGSACDIVAPGISGCGVASISAACAGSASSTNKGIATVKWASAKRAKG
mmetsp:Transcript_4518/g.14992  ORF Transcript_4518/g.14992 Transcript_4518/m.14992 type:complete len:175 (-) Transcript_4518:2-526(-)